MIESIKKKILIINRKKKKTIGKYFEERIDWGEFYRKEFDKKKRFDRRKKFSKRIRAKKESIEKDSIEEMIDRERFDVSRIEATADAQTSHFYIDELRLPTLRNYLKNFLCSLIGSN